MRHILKFESFRRQLHDKVRPTPWELHNNFLGALLWEGRYANYYLC